MKQKDIALIVLIGGISAILSFIISGRLFTSPENRQQEVEVIEPISAEITQPPQQYYNPNSINPTQTITIQPDDNQNLFEQ